MGLVSLVELHTQEDELILRIKHTHRLAPASTCTLKTAARGRLESGPDLISQRMQTGACVLTRSEAEPYFQRVLP